MTLFDNGGYIGTTPDYSTPFQDVVRNGLQLYLDAANPSSYGGTENLVTNSTNLSGWLALGATIAETTGYDGTNTAYTITDFTVDGYGVVYSFNDDVLYETVQTYTVTCRLKKTEADVGTWAAVQATFVNATTSATGTPYTIYVRPDTGDFVNLDNSATNVSVTSDGEWWFIKFNVQSQGTGYGRLVYALYPAISVNGPYVADVSLLGSNTFWNLQIQRGTTFLRDIKTTGTVLKRETNWFNLGSVEAANATLSGTAFSSDKGGAIVFGNGDVADIPAGLTFSGTGTGYTISIWVRHTGLIDTSRIQRYFTLGPEAAVLRHSTVTAANLNAYSFDSGAVQRTVNTSDQVFTGIYYNFVSVYNGSSITLYRNGAQVGTSALTFTLRTPNTAQLGNTTEYFEGNMHVVKYYNRPLNALEVVQNYNAVKGRFGL